MTGEREGLRGVRTRPADWQWFTLIGVDGLEWKIWGIETDFGWRGALAVGGLMVNYLKGFYQLKGNKGETNETE